MHPINLNFKRTTYFSGATPLDICRLHLYNLKLSMDKDHPGTNLAEKTLIRVDLNKIELLLNNLVLTYSYDTVILALRSLKMYKYCIKYLKVG